MAATVLVGVPAVLFWLRLFGRINLLAIVLLGALLSAGLGFGLALLLARGNYHLINAPGLALFVLSGVLIAAIA